MRRDHHQRNLLARIRWGNVVLAAVIALGAAAAAFVLGRGGDPNARLGSGDGPGLGPDLGVRPPAHRRQGPAANGSGVRRRVLVARSPGRDSRRARHGSRAPRRRRFAGRPSARARPPEVPVPPPALRAGSGRAPRPGDGEFAPD